MADKPGNDQNRGAFPITPTAAAAGRTSAPQGAAGTGNAGESSDGQGPPSLLPALSVPKGGGAIRGIGEKFSVNAATGTASLSVPLAASPGRSGFGPALALSYDSGNGNGPFGLGFHLSVRQITRKTDKGLPRYLDQEESDEFILSGAEDLVPVRNPDGTLNEIDRGAYSARRYRPRVEGAFSRIERWVRKTDGDSHWRITSRDNVTNIYGQTSGARIQDPQFSGEGASARTFTWLLEFTQDDKGNVVKYVYKAEDGAGVDPRKLSEKCRFENGVFTATAQRYLKRVLYTNAVPFVADDFLMELVFDYGEHLPAQTNNNDVPSTMADSVPSPSDADRAWPVRVDPFSTYRPTFDLRTYRLCRRVLMFHRLTDQVGAERPALLVKSTDFTYEPGAAFTYLTGVTQAGYLFDPTAERWQRQVLPTLALDYSRPVVNDMLSVLPKESLDGIEGGVDGARKQWVDLDGEGIPGVLIDQDSAWYYKANAGQGALRPPRVLSALPSPASLEGGTQQLQDLGGDGQLDLVSYDDALAGYFTRTPDGSFEPLRAFPHLPNIDWQDPNLRFIDLDGDGLPDLLISEDQAFVWYHSLGKQGFNDFHRVVHGSDEDRSPAVVFADSTHSIQLADMSGSGLVDIVRIRNGEVCYWPNLGYGRFGRKITLENSPSFATMDEFDARRVRFSDVDGSGTSDLFYLGARGTTLYFNQSGNALSAPTPISSLPVVDSLTQLSVVDLLGQGTACLVWSSPVTSTRRSVMFVDLMAGQKPHLMKAVTNNLGATTELSYAPSTKFYLADKAAGTPWLTRLPFPVHVVEKSVRTDAISKSQLTTRYSYHHGFFDGVEREFRGFARVEQIDAEEFTVGADTELFQAPVRTVTWFHTGAWLEKERLERELAKEYFQGGPPALLLADTVLPAGLTIQEEREATRALRGQMLRQEMYANDATPQASFPYLTTEQNFGVRLLQSSKSGKHGVFFSHPLETVAVHSERNPNDPRVTHELVLEVDDFGNVKRKASIAYGRSLTAPGSHLEQQRAWVTLNETDFINVPDQDFYRIGVESEARTFELTGLAVPSSGQGLLRLDELVSFLASATDIPYDISATPGTAQRRLIARKQQLFYATDLLNPLPLGQVGELGLPYESYQLALTTGLVTALTSESQTLSGTPFDPALLQSQGRYVQRDANYWAPSGRVLFDPTQAVNEFYLPKEAVDAFGSHSFVTFDAFSLLVTSTRDALDNLVQSANDYRVLAPVKLTDPNLNQVAVAFDALGMVVATAVSGKGSDVGDTLADPTTRLVYDLLRWQTAQQPTFVHTFAREQHGPSNTRYQESYAYSDGFGRVAMQKVQAEPGEVPGSTSTVNPRWVGTGRTVFNNKGNPVKQYEPFFSATSAFEDEDAIVATGVTPIIHYDPLDRVIRTELPNGTESRVTFDVWTQASFDPNDTVLTSTWYSSRGSPLPTGPEPSDPEQRAAWLAAQHANTPTVVHLDALGRPFLSVADNHVNGVGSFFETKTELDIEGNALAITDARGIRTIEQNFDVLKRRIRLNSPDAGTRLAVADVAGKPLRAWDSRRQTHRSRYDALQRATHAYVQVGNTERLLLRTVFGEALDLGSPPSTNPSSPSPAQALNLRGKPHQLYDCAGLVTNARADFKGNPLETSRTLARDYHAEPNWFSGQDLAKPADIFNAVASLLDNSEPFKTSSTYDALNRVISQTSPDGSVHVPTYNEANLLEKVHVSVRGGPSQLVIQNIDYNARGQRVLCEYANPLLSTDAAPVITSRIRYSYDAFTFRLTRLLTTRNSDNAALQKLDYTYDPAGNIVELDDRADTSPLFSGTTPLSADGRYEYDAIYRLTRAIGREHPGTQPVDTDSPPGTAIPHPNDLQALQRYVETYAYDAVGNIQQIAHTAGPSGTGGWTRNYDYFTDSNRLRATSVPGSPLALSLTYGYENSASNTAGAHGSMTSMPHLAAIEWDHADRMQRVDKGGGGQVFFTYDASGQRVRKVWEHGVVEERIYLGGFEIYRKRLTLGGVIDLERETLHVMDDQRRVAMVEAKTQEDGDTLATPVTRWRFQLDNHLGSAMLEHNEAGGVISYEEYHPYGSTAFSATSSSSEVNAKRYRYTGKERDEETGLYYHGARYYAPWLGRWTAADPAGLKDGLNIYRYSRSNPIAYSDPGGTESKSFAAPGSADYKVGTSKDPELIGYLKSLTPEQRADFVNSASGKFKERTETALRAGHLGSVVAVPEVTIEGSRSQGDAVALYASGGASSGPNTVEAPHFASAPPLPTYLVRKEYPELAKALRESGLDIAPEVAPEASSLTAVEHALGMHKATGELTPFLSVSEKFPGGAQGFSGSRLFINKETALSLGAEYTPHGQLAELVRAEHPEARWLETNPITEREGAFRGSIPGAAVEGPGLVALRYGARGLQVAGVAVTVYNLGAAANESVKTGSAAPIAAQSIREAGGWGSAVLGAKAGAALGAAVGIETGPGALVSGFAGGVLFGTAGYFGFDWVADFVHKN